MVSTPKKSHFVGRKRSDLSSNKACTARMYLKFLLLYIYINCVVDMHVYGVLLCEGGSRVADLHWFNAGTGSSIYKKFGSGSGIRV